MLRNAEMESLPESIDHIFILKINGFLTLLIVNVSMTGWITDAVYVVFLHMKRERERVCVWCRHVTVIAKAIKCHYTDSCSGSFIKWWSERESWKDEANRRGCKSAEERSAQVDETFPGRLPPGSAAPHWPFRHFSIFLTKKSWLRAVLNFTKSVFFSSSDSIERSNCIFERKPIKSYQLVLSLCVSQA